MAPYIVVKHLSFGHAGIELVHLGLAVQHVSALEAIWQEHVHGSIVVVNPDFGKDVLKEMHLSANIVVITPNYGA